MSKETYADFLFKMEKGGVDIPWFRKPHPHTKEEKAMNPEQIWTMIQTNAREQFSDAGSDAEAISGYLATEQGSKLYDQYLQAKEGAPSEHSEPPSEPFAPEDMTKGAQIQKAALNRLERLARERQALKKGMTYEQAYSEILGENPELYTAARP